MWMILTTWVTVVCVQLVSSFLISLLLVWLVCLVRFVNVWMFVTMKYLLRSIWSMRRLFLLWSTLSLEQMLCHSSWTRQTRWLKLRTSVVCLHWGLVVFLVNVPDLRFVTFTIHTMVVYARLRLLKVRISVWSLPCVYSLKLMNWDSLKLRTVKWKTEKWIFPIMVWFIWLLKKKKKRLLHRVMLRWMMTVHLSAIKLNLVRTLTSRL